MIRQLNDFIANCRFQWDFKMILIWFDELVYFIRFLMYMQLLFRPSRCTHCYTKDPGFPKQCTFLSICIQNRLSPSLTILAVCMRYNQQILSSARLCGSLDVCPENTCRISKIRADFEFVCHFLCMATNCSNRGFLWFRPKDKSDTRWVAQRN